MTESISKTTTMSLVRLLAVLICLLPAVVYGAERVRLKVTIIVTNEKGQPVPGAKIEIDRTGDTDDRGKPVKSITDVTDDQGRFSTTGDLRFFELTGKPHKIRVTAPGVEVPFEKEISDDALRAAAKDKELVVTFPAGNSKPQTVRLKVNGRVTNLTGQPVEKAQISMVKSAGGEVKETASGADGKYELSQEFQLSDGTVQVHILAPDYKPQIKDIKFSDLKPGEENLLAIDVQLAPEGTVFDDILLALKYLGLAGLLALVVVLGFKGWRFVDQWRKSAPVKTLTVSESLITEISRSLTDIKTSMVTKSDLNKEIVNLTDHITVSLHRVPPPPAPDGFPKNDVNRNQNQPRVEHMELPKTGLEGAQSSYRKLINKTLVSPDPIYLDVEGARSAAGKLQDSNIYLTQVSSSQSALVLFSDGGSIGWVYPNPKVAFRPAALKDVFPNLSEADYEAAKENVHPMNVRRLEEGRWLVDQN
jgi:hypothetical protein